ncbi:arsenic resistance N-acetyltransferase ArsN2 [Pseudomonas sp. SMN5]|uniref:arsenic resistance N-acetyltransferase ArsN2 n=1 Tax=Pseudomonas sp. SMN5 TaxID=3390198 RepID=UPI003F855F23
MALAINKERSGADMESELAIQATQIVGERFAQLRSALESAGLPTADVELSGRTFFEFTLDGLTVGWGGFEAYGADGLLRSLVVEPVYRSKGVGASMLRLIERIAACNGIDQLHLLTTNASGFFEAFGYHMQPRGCEPIVISRTEQFRGLCPGSASYMCKTLSGSLLPTKSGQLTDDPLE